MQDWIKVEKTTARKTEILQIAGLLNIHPDHAFGLCVRFWCWADDQIADGYARGVTLSLLECAFGHDGFVAALASVGWLEEVDGGVRVCNWDRHLSKSAKSRALAKTRVAKAREKETEMLRAERNEKCDSSYSLSLSSSNSSSKETCPLERVADQLRPFVESMNVDGLSGAVRAWCEYRLRADGRPPDAISLKFQLEELYRARPDGMVSVIRASIQHEKPRLFADADSRDAKKPRRYV